MQITVTDEMRQLVRLIESPNRACEYDSVTHDLANLVIAAIEEQEQNSGN